MAYAVGGLGRHRKYGVDTVAGGEFLDAFMRVRGPVNTERKQKRGGVCRTVPRCACVSID